MNEIEKLQESNESMLCAIEVLNSKIIEQMEGIKKLKKEAEVKPVRIVMDEGLDGIIVDFTDSSGEGSRSHYETWQGAFEFTAKRLT